MPELDRLKEQLAYLKFWQGIMVVTDISLVGWLVSTAWCTRFNCCASDYRYNRVDRWHRGLVAS
jgi:hypothetical protein